MTPDTPEVAWKWPLPFSFRSAFLVVNGTANILMTTWALIRTSGAQEPDLGALFWFLVWLAFELVLLAIALIYLVVGFFRRRPEPGILVDWLGPPLFGRVFVWFWLRFVLP